MKKLFVLLMLTISISAHAASDNSEIITSAIADSLKEKGILSDINNGLTIKLFNDNQMKNIDITKAQVSILDVNEKNNTFSASISDGANTAELKGKYSEMISVPTLSHNISKGEIISDKDITFTQVEKAATRYGIATDVSELVGKSPVRQVVGGKPVMLSSISEPKIITKNKVVTIIYQNNALTIQSTAAAVEDGAKGEFIKFKNVASGKIITAKVVNDNLAEITNGNSNIVALNN